MTANSFFILADAAPFVFVVFFLAMMLVGLLVHLRQRKLERERAIRVEAAASDLGFEYHADGTWLLNRLGRVHLFKQGRGKKLFNVLADEQEALSTYLFDYQWTTGSGKNSRTHRRTVAAFELAEMHFPGFEMRPETFGHKFISAFGYQDIDLEEFPRFSDQYLLRGVNEAAVRRLFNAEVTRFFEVRGQWCAGADGRWLVLYRDVKRMQPHEAMQFLERASEAMEIVYAASQQVRTERD